MQHWGEDRNNITKVEFQVLISTKKLILGILLQTLTIFVYK